MDYKKLTKLAAIVGKSVPEVMEVLMVVLENHGKNQEVSKSLGDNSEVFVRFVDKDKEKKIGLRTKTGTFTFSIKRNGEQVGEVICKESLDDFNEDKMEQLIYGEDDAPPTQLQAMSAF